MLVRGQGCVKRRTWNIESSGGFTSFPPQGLCNGGAPCPTCALRPAKKPWAEWFNWFYVQMMMCAQKRRCMEEAWWDYFDLPDIEELPRAVLPPIPDNRPGSRPPPPDIPPGHDRSQGAKSKSKQKPRARSGGSPGATPRHSGQAASTTAADVREPSTGESEDTNPARQVKIEVRRSCCRSNPRGRQALQEGTQRLSSLNRERFKPFRSHSVLLS